PRISRSRTVRKASRDCEGAIRVKRCPTPVRLRYCPATATLLMPQSYLYRRHTLLVRITHWINVIALTALLMSGLQIFNEHPALYGARNPYRGKPAILEVPKEFPFHKPSYTGKPATIELASKFPSWMTIPSGQWLAMGRRWHFFFAWLFVINAGVYLAHSLAS